MHLAVGVVATAPVGWRWGRLRTLARRLDAWRAFDGLLLAGSAKIIEEHGVRWIEHEGELEGLHGQVPVVLLECFESGIVRTSNESLLLERASTLGRSELVLKGDLRISLPGGLGCRTCGIGTGRRAGRLLMATVDAELPTG